MHDTSPVVALKIQKWLGCIKQSIGGLQLPKSKVVIQRIVSSCCLTLAASNPLLLFLIWIFPNCSPHEPCTPFCTAAHLQQEGYLSQPPLLPNKKGTLLGVGKIWVKFPQAEEAIGPGSLALFVSDYIKVNTLRNHYHCLCFRRKTVSPTQFFQRLVVGACLQERFLGSGSWGGTMCSGVEGYVWLQCWVTCLSYGEEVQLQMHPCAQCSSPSTWVLWITSQRQLIGLCEILPVVSIRHCFD